MKGFLRVVIWGAIFATALFGIYMILPEYPQNFAKSIVQPVFNNEAEIMISKVKALQNKDVENATYETILEANAKNPCWVYSVDEANPQVQYVTFYGRGIGMNLKDWTDYQGNLSTSAIVKIEFKITGSSVEIIPYVDGVKMQIEDGRHVEENKKIKQSIFEQLYKGIKSED